LVLLALALDIMQPQAVAAPPVLEHMLQLLAVVVQIRILRTQAALADLVPVAT
jgi:hypothetical protein